MSDYYRTTHGDNVIAMDYCKQLERTLIENGFSACDNRECNCGGWHRRGPDWKSLAINYVCASDDVGESQDEYAMSYATTRMDDAYHALTEAVRNELTS